MSSEQKVQPPKGVLRKNSKYNENFTPTKKNDNTYGTPQKQGDFLSLDGDLICQPSDPSSSKNIFIGTEGQTPKKLLEFDRFEPPSSLRQNILPTVSEDDDRDEDGSPDAGGKYDENDNGLNDGVSERVLDLLRKQREKFSPDSTHIRTSYSNNNNNENNNSSRSSRASPLELFSAPVPERPKTSRARPCPSPDDFYDYVVPSPEPKANNAISKMLILQNKSKNKKKTRNKSSNNRDSVRSSIESNGSNGTTGSDTSGSAEFKVRRNILKILNHLHTQMIKFVVFLLLCCHSVLVFI